MLLNPWHSTCIIPPTSAGLSFCCYSSTIAVISHSSVPKHSSRHNSRHAGRQQTWSCRVTLRQRAKHRWLATQIGRCCCVAPCHAEISTPADKYHNTQRNVITVACLTAHRSNRSDHWPQAVFSSLVHLGHVQQLTGRIDWTIGTAYVRRVSCWTTFIIIQ